jgi:hypothetical protein
LPAALTGQSITGVHLRRSTLLGDVAYPSLQRTITVRGGFQTPLAAQMIGGLTQNRPPSAMVLFGPAVVTAPALPAPGPTTTTGAELVHIVFTQPLPVTAGTLYLEFETSNAPLQISTEHWVDAVWFGGGSDQGLAVAVGDGSCTTRSEPTELRWTSSTAPLSGTTAQLEVRGAPPTFGTSVGYVLAWVGVDPQTRAASTQSFYLGFGGSFTTVDPGLVGCHQWAPLDVAWFGPTDAQGRFNTTFPVPTAAVGARLGVQAAWLDPSRPVFPFSLSNGLMLVLNSAGVGNRCNSLYFPAGATASPWQPFVGQMPVLEFDY